MRRRISLRKSLFILPNAFTLGATFCGFYSILVVSQASRPWDFWAACLLIACAAILDGADGRVARLTRTQSEFGLQLDSLSDTVAFGVAPAWLVYNWGLYEIWPVGFLVAFFFAAACSLRLARFNVIAAEAPSRRYFVGLPAPIAAAALASVVAVHTHYLGHFRATGSAQISVAVLTVLMGLLMVSNIRFRSFKDLKVNRSTLLTVGMTVVALAYLGMLTAVEVGFLALITTYVAFHLAATAILLERRLRRGTEPSTDDEVLGLDEPEDEEMLA